MILDLFTTLIQILFLTRLFRLLLISKYTGTFYFLIGVECFIILMQFIDDSNEFYWYISTFRMYIVQNYMSWWTHDLTVLTVLYWVWLYTMYMRRPTIILFFIFLNSTILILRQGIAVFYYFLIDNYKALYRNKISEYSDEFEEIFGISDYSFKVGFILYILLLFFVLSIFLNVKAKLLFIIFLEFTCLFLTNIYKDMLFSEYNLLSTIECLFNEFYRSHQHTHELIEMFNNPIQGNYLCWHDKYYLERGDDEYTILLPYWEVDNEIRPFIPERDIYQLHIVLGETMGIIGTWTIYYSFYYIAISVYSYVPSFEYFNYIDSFSKTELWKRTHFGISRSEYYALRYFRWKHEDVLICSDSKYY